MSKRPELPPRQARRKGEKAALDGIRVVDFTRVIAGPMCTQMLGDLGASVIKVENPDGGDDSRSFQYGEIAGETSSFLSLNRNKRSIALDLALPAAQEVARALIARADVVVENFSTGIMERFGLDYATVSRGNPRLVYCSISAYGRKGPFAERPGYDPITQAESGFMSMNGFPDQVPVRTGAPVIDLSTGIMACNTILAALLARDRLGQGQQVEVVLFDMAVAMLGHYSMNYLVTGENQSRFGHAPGGSPINGLFIAADGPFFMTCANDRLYRRLAGEVLGRPDLANDPAFATARARSENKEKLRAILTEIFAGQPRDVWVAKMKAAKVPAGYVRTVEEALNAPEVRLRERVGAIAHPKAGTVPNVEPPYQLSLTPTIDPVAAPLLGQHTQAVLHDALGYDDAEIARLAAAGAFGRAKAR
ncbi:MAG TPA: CoA transferase [Candidatus Sulfotelmatobacter sp.]|nr:CoA transferase [Candidatus Sulfotelmatobacter sp.]